MYYPISLNCTFFRSCFWLLPLFTLTCATESKIAVDQSNIYSFIKENQIDQLHLQTNITHLIDHKNTEEQHSAKIVLNQADKQKIEGSITVAARGKTRKNYCDIPPLKIRFTDDQLIGLNLSLFNTIKLVSPCKTAESHQDLVLREYLCYKLYSILSPESFDAHLVQVHLTNTENGETIAPHYSFFIEPIKSLRQRLSAERFPKDQKLKTLDKKNYSRLSLFQFMIGNTDWNVLNQHNLHYVTLKGRNAPVPIPYDFDYSGLVNSDYAKPHPNLPVKNVRERLFQCRIKDHKLLEADIVVFKNKKEEIINTVNDFDLLTETSRNYMTEYILSFYEIIESEDPIQLLNSNSFAAKAAH